MRNLFLVVIGRLVRFSDMSYYSITLTEPKFVRWGVWFISIRRHFIRR